MCNFIQDDDSDRLDWQIHHGPTSSQNTGPITGHTTGEDSDSYLYLEASFGKPYDDAMWVVDTSYIYLIVLSVQYN